MSSSYSFIYINSEPVATNGPYIPSADYSPSTTAIESPATTSNDLPTIEGNRAGAVLQDIIDEFAQRTEAEAGSPPPGFEWGTRVSVNVVEGFEEDHPSPTTGCTLTEIMDDDTDPNDIPQWNFSDDSNIRNAEHVATTPRRRKGWLNKLTNILHDRVALRELLDETDISIAGALFAGVVEREKYVEQAVYEIRSEAQSFIEIS